MRANLSGEAAHKYASIMSAGLRDVLTDEEAAINAGFTEGVEVPVPENLPAVISRQIATTGGEIVPEWHMVKRLPGYLRNQVRAFGRLVLSQFTDTPIEDIQTVTTLTNDEIEVRALMAWIKANGIRDDRAEMDFGQTIPGYRADVQIWNVKDYSFLLVKDFAGYYVYGWPGGRGVHLENDAPRPLLR